MVRLNSIADSITEVLVLKLGGSKKTSAIKDISDDIAKTLASSFSDAPPDLDIDEVISGAFEAIAHGPTPEEIVLKHRGKIKAILQTPRRTLNRIYMTRPLPHGWADQLVRLFYEELQKHPKFGEIVPPSSSA